MKLPSFLALVPVLGLSLLSAAAEEPIYRNDFEALEVEKAPADFMILSGGFVVKAEGGGKVLELPASPLDAFGFLFGPSQQDGVSASARFFGTKAGRKFPAFGISLNGVGGYRLQVSPGKKALEIYRGDEPKSSVPWEWVSGSWVKLRIQVRKTGAGYVVEGKAWPAEAPEPATWLITLESSETLPVGRAGIWGSPYAGTPIQFDDLAVTPLQK